MRSRCMVSSQRDVSQLTGRRASLSNLYMGKGDALNRGLKLIGKMLKVLDCVKEELIRQRVEIDEMQCSFMSGHGTTDVIFVVRQLQEKHLVANKPLYRAFVDLRKHLIVFHGMSSDGQC